MTVPKCAREGCDKGAMRDPYCSAQCCRIAHGLEEPPSEDAKRAAYNERRRVARLRKKYGSHVEITNPDGMAHLAPGSAGTGGRRARYKMFTPGR